MSVPEKPTTVRLDPELRAKAEDAARSWSRSRRPSLSPFLEWAIRQVLNLDFLSQSNREFIFGITAELGSPWTALDVINVLLSSVRREVRSGKLKPLFWLGQRVSARKSEVSRCAAASDAQDIGADVRRDHEPAGRNRG